jgi:hypothetical protein
VWLDKYARRFSTLKFGLLSPLGVKIGIPSDDDELQYFVNGIEIADVIRRSDQRRAEIDAEKAMEHLG